jgi:MFS family permease
VGLYLLPGTFVALPAGIIANRFGEKQVSCIGLVAMTTGRLVLAAADIPNVLTIGRPNSGTGAVLLNMLVTKMVADWFEEKGAVTALGILVASWPEMLLLTSINLLIFRSLQKRVHQEPRE